MSEEITCCRCHQKFTREGPTRPIPTDARCPYSLPGAPAPQAGMNHAACSNCWLVCGDCWSEMTTENACA